MLAQILASAWVAYTSPVCAPSLAELITSPQLAGKIAANAEPMTITIRWLDGTKHVGRVVVSERGACLVEYQIQGEDA